MTEEIARFSGEHRFLSNFFHSPITGEWGITYPTVEHAFQAAKTLDLAEREHISRMPSPGQAKRAGQTLALRPYWDSSRVDVMHELLRKKFAPGTLLAKRLLATGDAELIEGNTWGDTFWGACRGQGFNQLGRLLMEVRADLSARTKETAQ